MKSMNAVILVAGREKKLLPYTENMHQCLFRLSDNKTLLEDTLEKLVSLNRIKKIILVVGHKKEMIFKELEHIKNRINFRDIICVENKDFMTTNVIYSLWLTRHYLLEPFLLIDGDIICERELFAKLIQSGDENENLLLVDFNYKLKNTDNKVKVVNDRIVQIGKKVRLSLESNFGRSVGIGNISSGNKKLINRMDELIQQNKTDLIYEDVLNELLPLYQFRPIATYGYNWMEVDSIDEFKKMHNIFSALDKLKDKALCLGATKVFPINPQDIVFDSKVSLSCYKCQNYDKKYTCPAHIPKIDYQKMILSYKKCLLVVLKFKIGEDWQKIREDSTRQLHHILLELEKFAFSHSYHFANSFIGGSCKLCAVCPPDRCRFPDKARSPLEAVGVDVVKTVGKVGLKLKFPVEKYFYRIGLLLVG